MVRWTLAHAVMREEASGCGLLETKKVSNGKTVTMDATMMEELTDVTQGLKVVYVLEVQWAE